MKIFGIIPARFASTRFPGKPLIMIQDKIMIQHVYENVSKCDFLEKVFVATDDHRIADAVKKFEGNVIMTSKNHKSGTDRCGEVATILQNEGLANDKDIIINIQGDEPFIDPKQIEMTISMFKNEEVKIATLARQLNSIEALNDPNVVKLVFSNNGKALYFSRQAIPFIRDMDKEHWHESSQFYEHIGIYAYKIKALKEIVNLPQGSLEKDEKLEQLRWLENSYNIHVNITNINTFSIDTPEDVEKLKQILD